ncbi:MULTISPECIES: hypothetical protein [Mycolicibacter]|uniref:Helix-turn-helix domain-containing protein n=2 Tax=Mycolicibacter TaxID=1073531 RepID=A0ABU5XMJ8_9MYCO|nr:MULTISPECIES: hypothetical protein [unclassified Mycolicibacter]MEB3023434.1 hypothetical protein [Mycolicibacter sp. MYC098]MEB3033776.1 hypothetical protein [Mycolicibacter sp. MYC340]
MTTTGLKFPPAGVETAPTSTDIVSLRDAARILGRDHRTVQAMITKGTLRGGAEPQPQRLRWYVYRDALPATTADSQTIQSADQTAVIADQAAVIADQAARIVTLEHNNRLLAGGVEDLLDGLEHYKAGAESALQAARHFEAAAAKYGTAVRAHRDALAQYMTPSNISALDS